MAGRITKADMREAARALGIPEHLDEPEKKPRRRSRRSEPAVVRSYRPDEDAQLRAISAVLRDAVPIEKREPRPQGLPEAQRKGQDALRAGTSIQES